VQALGVGLMTIAAAIVNNRMKGRLAGVGDALLSNPNDLAMNIALNWPLCLIFLLMSRGPLKKMFWGITMLIMIYALMATYSRAGFLALSVAVIICLWEFGIRGRRRYLLIGAAVCLVGMVIVAPGNYAKRLETLVGRFQEGDRDLGSAEARTNLLVTSLKVTATHPVFGVGPGNFPPYTGLWLVTHNTYTQLSSECGIPALILFLILMWRAFLNLREVRKIPRSKENEPMHLYAGALTASFAAYALGAFFSSSAYELFPYYMIIYTTLLHRLALQGKDGEPARVLGTPIRVGRELSPV
jgi:putative inorganic carbon (hco3(-)) transporter